MELEQGSLDPELHTTGRETLAAVVTNPQGTVSSSEWLAGRQIITLATHCLLGKTALQSACQGLPLPPPPAEAMVDRRWQVSQLEPWRPTRGQMDK